MARDTWATVKRQFDPPPADRLGAGEVDAVGEEGVDGEDWVAGVDADVSSAVRASPEHPVASRATSRVAAVRAVRSFGIASPHRGELWGHPPRGS
jgi:hypothetical protein